MRFWIVCLGCLLGLLGPSDARAQLNESDTSGLQLRAGASGAWQQGNVNVLVVRGFADLTAGDIKNLVFKTANTGLFQSFGGRRADADVFGQNFLYWRPRSRVYPFAMFFVRSNFRRKIRYSLFGGAGCTVQLLRQAGQSIKLSAAFVYETARFASDTFNQSFFDGSASINLWRATLYLAGRHSLPGERLVLFYHAYWQPALHPVANHRVQTDVGLEFPVWKGLNFRAEYVLNYEQVVSKGVFAWDHILTFGLNYKFKKTPKKRHDTETQLPPH